jgi:hypothetical protein
MSFSLPLYNPSDYWRTGHITVPWREVLKKAQEAHPNRKTAKVHLDPEQLVLLDDSNTPLPFQIDQIDPNDSSSKTLSFALNKWLEPGDNDYSHSTGTVVVAEGRGVSPLGIDPKLDVYIPENSERGVKLINSRLEVWLNLIPDLKEDWRAENPVYAGAATSVQLDGTEILDYNVANIWGHDPEKRCMQLDYIKLPCPSWDIKLYQRVDMFNRRYRIISKSIGPVRVNVTVESDPFDHEYWDPFIGEMRQLSCNLYRVISLFASTKHIPVDYILEELFVKGVPKDGGEKVGSVNLFFIPNYFTYLNALKLHSSHLEDVPDWFTVGSLARPFNGYSFATDVHVNSLSYPHPGFEKRDNEGNSFSWQLCPTRSARALHLFMRFKPSDEASPVDWKFIQLEGQKSLEAKHYFEDRTGRAWYESIYKPLAAVRPA